MDTLSLIQNEIKTLPDFKAQEVLDFIIFLKTRNNDRECHEQNSVKAQELSSQKKYSNSIKSEILNIGINCASLPLLDNRSVDEILGYDNNGIPK